MAKRQLYHTGYLKDISLGVFSKSRPSFSGPDSLVSGGFRGYSTKGVKHGVFAAPVTKDKKKSHPNPNTKKSYSMATSPPRRSLRQYSIHDINACEKGSMSKEKSLLDHCQLGWNNMYEKRHSNFVDRLWKRTNRTSIEMHKQSGSATSSSHKVRWKQLRQRIKRTRQIEQQHCLPVL